MVVNIGEFVEQIVVEPDFTVVPATVPDRALPMVQSAPDRVAEEPSR